MEKNVPRSGRVRIKQKSKRWTLLFVDDRGKTIAFKRFKGLVTLVMLLVVASAVVAAGSYFLYFQLARERRQLEDALVASRQKTRLLIKEKETLAARLGIAESIIGGESKKAASSPLEKRPSPVGEEVPVPIAVNNPDEDPPPIDGPAFSEQEAGVLEVTESPTDPVASTGPVKVAVEGLKVFPKSGRNRMEVKFTLKNIDTGTEPITGYTFVVLKDDGNDTDGWFVFPKVDMVSGKPASVKGGRYFQISRFKTITFDTQEKVTPEKFRAATVLIYNKTGELILAKDFSLNKDS